jgi:hypothetical protein
VLIPAAFEGVLRFSAETEYLTVTTQKTIGEKDC